MTHDNQTRTIQDKINAWIDDKKIDGCTVDFSIGKILLPDGKDMLTAYWFARKNGSRFSSLDAGCIGMDGEAFYFH